MSAVPGAAQWRGSARVIVQGIAHLWKQRRQKLGAVDAASRNFDELGTAVGVGGVWPKLRRKGTLDWSITCCS